MQVSLNTTTVWLEVGTKPNFLNNAVGPNNYLKYTYKILTNKHFIWPNITNIQFTNDFVRCKTKMIVDYKEKCFEKFASNFKNFL